MNQQFNPDNVQQSPTTLQQNIPLQSLQKTNWFLYVIIIIISFGILISLTGGLSLATGFLPLTSFVIVYVYSSIISFVIGLITAFILNKVAKSNKSFLLGGSIISFLAATMVSIILIVYKNLAAEISTLELGLTSLFGKTPNSFLSAILIIIFFNIFFLVLFFRKEQKSMKDLMIYLYSFIIFLILYFVAPLLILFLFK